MDGQAGSRPGTVRGTNPRGGGVEPVAQPTAADGALARGQAAG